MQENRDHEAYVELWVSLDERENEEDTGATEIEGQQVHREPRESKVVEDYPAPSARKVKEEKPVTPEMSVNPDTTVTREKTVRLDCPVSLEKWDREVSLVKEVSQVFPDLQEFPEVKAAQVEKVTPVLLERPVLLDKQDHPVRSVRQDLKEFLDHPDHRALVVKTVYPVSPVLTVHLDTMVTLELLETKEIVVLPDLRVRLGSPASVDPKETKEPEV